MKAPARETTPQPSFLAQTRLPAAGGPQPRRGRLLQPPRLAPRQPEGSRPSARDAHPGPPPPASPQDALPAGRPTPASRGAGGLLSGRAGRSRALPRGPRTEGMAPQHPEGRPRGLPLTAGPPPPPAILPARSFLLPLPGYRLRGTAAAALRRRSRGRAGPGRMGSDRIGSDRTGQPPRRGVESLGTASRTFPRVPQSPCGSYEELHGF